MAQSLQDPGMVEAHSFSDFTGMAWSVVSLGSETALGQGDQLGIAAETALIEAREGIGQFSPGRLALDLARATPSEGWFAGQKLAEDRAERKHVGTFVDLIAFATGLLGSHVGRRPHD